MPRGERCPESSLYECGLAQPDFTRPWEYVRLTEEVIRLVTLAVAL